MTWVNLPIATDEGPLSRAEKAVLKLVDGDTCRVRTSTGEDVEATVDTSRGGCVFRDDDGDAIDVAAVWAAPPGGASGKGGKTELVRLPPIYVTPAERERCVGLAARAGESLSAWARRKLAT